LCLAEAAARCEDVTVGKLLHAMVKEEARHAALAWKTVQWALQQSSGNNSSVVQSVVEAFNKPSMGSEGGAKGLEK
jgi:hypothetical protein